MSDLDTVAKLLNYFYRLTGEESGDPDMETNSEATDEVGYTCLTMGCRAAQRWMISMHYGGWRKRSSAITWLGTDDTTGGRYAAVPDDFLRAYGSARRSAMTEANGDRWGKELNPEMAEQWGQFYYFEGEVLWITRKATPPSPIYLDYHYRHPVWTSVVAIDFPLEARSLIPAFAASIGMEENWLPGGPELEYKIERSLGKAKERARDIARATKSPRTFRSPYRAANRW